MKYVEIRELGEIITGKTPPTENQSFYDGDYPFITPTDIESFDKKYLYSTERTLSSLGAKKVKSCKLPAKSICFVCIGSTIGKMCMTNCESYTNQQINSVIPNKGCDNDYLFYYLRYVNEYFRSIGAGTGSGKGIVNKTVFSKTKIQINEDKKEQKRIADILSTYDELIENNNKRIKILEQTAENLYKEWFVHSRFPGHETTEFENGIPKGWENTTFDVIASFQNGYAFESKELMLESGVNTYEVFKQGHIKRGGGFKLDGTKSWYPKDFCCSLGKFILKKEDLLMAMTDMKDNVAILGNTAIMPFNDRFILNQRVGLIRPTGYRKVGYEYIYLLTNSYDFVQDLRGRANRGVQVNLSSIQIKLSNVLVPSCEINIKFKNIINPIFEQVFNILNQNENLIKQRDMLLPRLMSGKLEVN